MEQGNQTSTWVQTMTKVLQIKSQIPSLGNCSSSGLESPLTADLIYNDSIKAIFGTGSDSYIMHDGSNMYLEDTATGRLVYNTNATFASGKCLGLNSATCYHCKWCHHWFCKCWMNVNLQMTVLHSVTRRLWIVADFTGADVTMEHILSMTAGNSSRTVVIKANGTPNPKFLMPADFSLEWF